ncbi:baculoviral IAP repeat-containing protein 3 isoform X2 [Copidosoma floridanum]|uniref:baculoviral IAP repeat-containing protein 3 isoform X2 n=1 Tax=Copidosoma floridanum TaxID=29053 RepID=UPI0006C99FB4|nr:baculoviral IAP repeat-containing protein 3 isoform X2 [Copidosoma floridanum]
MAFVLEPKFEKFSDLRLKEGKMAGLLDRRETVFSPCILKPNSTPRAPTPPQPESNEVDDAGSMDYRFEEARLQSFENWPSPYVRPADLAAAGFYYTKQIDRVRCFECKTEICCWEDGDDPMSEHQRWGGRCRFIRKLPCGNVPIGADASAIPPPRPRGRDVCGPYGLDYRLSAEADTHAATMNPSSSSSTGESKDQSQMLPSPARLGTLGIAIAKKPDFPDYQSYEARLASFADWPASMAQTKEKMAEAGFFYSGTEDQTTCYHCGGGLKKWEPQDDPWVQHAKWFSTCFYVRVVKGQEFINGVVGKEMPSLSEEEISRMNLPGYIQKVNASSILQKREMKQEQTEQSQMEESSENTAGPSTACPTPMPRTKVNETVATVSMVNSNSSSDIVEQQQQEQEQEQPQQAQVQQLQQQQEKEQQVLPTEKKPMDDARACKICYNEELGIVFLPCGHIVACIKCAPDMTTCAVCRKKVDMIVRAFFS